MYNWSYYWGGHIIQDGLDAAITVFYR